MYEKRIKIGQKYVGISASIFIDAVLNDANINKKDITDKDLEAIAKSAVKKLNSYGLDANVYSEPVQKDILNL